MLDLSDGQDSDWRGGLQEEALMTSKRIDMRPEPILAATDAASRATPLMCGLRAIWIRERSNGAAQCDWNRRFPRLVEGAVERRYLTGNESVRLSVDAGRLRELAEFLCTPEATGFGVALRLASRIAGTIPAAVQTWLRGRSDSNDGLEGGDREVWLDLHLPLLDRQRAADLPAAFDECRVEARHGAIFVKPAGERAPDYELRYCTTAALAASFCAPSGEAVDFPLAWSDRRLVRPEQWALLMEPLLEAYGMNEVRPPTAPVLVRWRFETSADVARAWLLCPRERTTAHLELFQPVSRAIQLCLRRWLPYVGLSAQQTFRNRDLAYALAVYRAGRPFWGRGRPELTYDLLSRTGIEAACASARRGLPQRLLQIRQYLQTTGCDAEVAWFHPRAAQKAIAQVARGNKAFLRLLAADREAVERFLRWGAEYYRRTRLSRERDPSRRLLRAAEMVDRPFRKYFRRLLPGEDLSALGPLLQIEATIALNRALKTNANARIVLEIEAQSGNEISVTSRTICSSM